MLSDEDAWTYAQILVSLNSGNVQALSKQDHISFFSSQMETTSTCWVEFRQPTDKSTGKSTGPCHMGATGWVLLSLTILNEKASKQTWDFIFSRQSPNGWWAIYEPADISESNASTYATYLTILAIHLHLEKKLIPNELIEDAKRRKDLASSWLMSKRLNGQCVWPDYPAREDKHTNFIGITGGAIYTLNRIGYPGLDELNKLCLSQLSTTPISPSMYYSSLLNIKITTAALTVDHVRHMSLVWAGMAITSIYSKGSLFEKARARSFLLKSLFNNTSTPDHELQEPWQAAEFSIFLRHLLGSSIL